MLDWLTLRDPYIGGIGYNVFMWSGFAVWVWLTTREIEFKKNFWILFRIVFFSFVGSVAIPLIILIIQTAIRGQLFNYTHGVGKLLYEVYTPEGFVRFFKFAFKGFSITAGIFTLALILVFIKKKWRHFLYPFVYPFPLFAAIIRLGCFADGCCFGKPTDLPIGVVFPPGSYASFYHYAKKALASRYAPSPPLHPVQLYISASMLLLFMLLVVLRRRGFSQDAIVSWSLIGYGIANFLIEFLRQEPKILVGLTAGQIIELAVAAIGVYLLVEKHRQSLSSSAPDTRGRNVE